MPSENHASQGNDEEEIYTDQPWPLGRVRSGKVQSRLPENSQCKAQLQGRQRQRGHPPGHPRVSHIPSRSPAQPLWLPEVSPAPRNAILSEANSVVSSFHPEVSCQSCFYYIYVRAQTPPPHSMKAMITNREQARTCSVTVNKRIAKYINKQTRHWNTVHDIEIACVKIMKHVLLRQRERSRRQICQSDITWLVRGLSM